MVTKRFVAWLDREFAEHRTQMLRSLTQQYAGLEYRSCHSGWAILLLGSPHLSASEENSFVCYQTLVV